MAGMARITARPEALRHVAAVAGDVGEELTGHGRRLAATLEGARTGLGEFRVPVADLDADLRALGLAARRDATGVERVAAAFEAADGTTLAGRRTVDERSFEEHLARLEDDRERTLRQLREAWERVEGPLSHVATRSLTNAVGAATGLQGLRSTGRYAQAWFDHQVTRLVAGTHARLRTLHHRTLLLRHRDHPTVQRLRARVWDSYDGQLAGGRARMGDALDGMKRGRGAVRTVGRIVRPVGVLADGSTLLGGSQYEGTRGSVDRVMAGAGLVAIGVVAVASSPVLVAGGIALGVAATAWGIGNLVADNWERISAGARRVGRGVRDAASTVGGGIASGARSVGSGIASGVRSVGGFLGIGG